MIVKYSANRSFFLFHSALLFKCLINFYYEQHIFLTTQFFQNISFLYSCRMGQLGPQKRREHIGFGKKDENLPPGRALGTWVQGWRFLTRILHGEWFSGWLGSLRAPDHFHKETVTHNLYWFLLFFGSSAELPGFKNCIFKYLFVQRYFRQQNDICFEVS
jgi:hypothetical protein